MRGVNGWLSTADLLRIKCGEEGQRVTRVLHALSTLRLGTPWDGVSYWLFAHDTMPSCAHPNQT